MPRVTLNPEFRVKSRSRLNPEIMARSLGELPTDLGWTPPKQQAKAVVPIDPPSTRESRHPLATTESTADAIAKSYAYTGEGDIDDEYITKLAYKPHAGGRPSDYSKKFPRIVFEFALIGLSDERIAIAMDIDITTFHAWRKAHPEFSQALKDGRDNADRQVANAMFKRAVGFKYDAVKIMPNKHDPEQPIYAKYEEYVPPDVSAGRWWMGVRRKKDGWADAPDGQTPLTAVQVNINVADPQEAAKQYRQFINGDVE